MDSQNYIFKFKIISKIIAYLQFKATLLVSYKIAFLRINIYQMVKEKKIIAKKL